MEVFFFLASVFLSSYFLIEGMIGLTCFGIALSIVVGFLWRKLSTNVNFWQILVLSLAMIFFVTGIPLLWIGLDVYVRGFTETTACENRDFSIQREWSCCSKCGGCRYVYYYYVLANCCGFCSLCREGQWILYGTTEKTQSISLTQALESKVLLTCAYRPTDGKLSGIFDLNTRGKASNVSNLFFEISKGSHS